VISKLVVLALLFPSLSSAACIPCDQAQRHIGETQYVSGKVLRVESGCRGVHYLDFCEDHELCPFSVVVFASDLKRIGEVGQLAGKLVEIRGEVKEYDGAGGDHSRQCEAIGGRSNPTASAAENV